MARACKGELTLKMKAFCEEYVKDYNATQAYLRAYGGEYTTANNRGCAMLKDSRIKDYIKELQKEGFEQACINAERIAMELAEMAFAEKGDEDYSASIKLKALDLLQKQLGLQQQKIDAKVDKTVIRVSVEDDTNDN